MRDRALLLLGSAGAFRRSELAALTLTDLLHDDAGLRITVRRSKTDQEGKGQIVAILAGTRLKPVHAVAEWLEASRITEGPLFRAVDRHGRVLPMPLSTRSIAEIVKKYARTIGLDADHFSAIRCVLALSPRLRRAAQAFSRSWMSAVIARLRRCAAMCGTPSCSRIMRARPFSRQAFL
jgi:integrase